MAASILLVDDDEILSQVLRRVLTRQGHTVVEAANVAQAVQLAREHELCLGLLDLCLPDGDGIELARRLEGENKQFPLILITAYPLRLHDHPELAERFNQVLTKPLNLDELRKAIETTLRNPTPDADLKAKLAALAHAPKLAARDLTLHTPLPEPVPVGQPAAAVEAPRAPRPARARPDAPPANQAQRRRKRAAGLAILAAGVVAAILTIRGWAGSPAEAPETRPPAKPRLVVELVEGPPHTIRVSESVQTGLAIPASTVAQLPTQARPLIMPGSTDFEPARVSRIKTRFNAKVVEMGEVADETQQDPSDQPPKRPLRPGDKVHKGDVLAVVWSVDVGSKKSDLVDALAQLQLDEKRLRVREELFEKGSLPEDTLNQTRRDVINDRNAKGRAERTLRTWDIPEREIKAVYEEADLISAREGKRDLEKERLWARSELVAPRDGIIVECNVGVGEYVADNTINLFVIADVGRLLIKASPPEDVLAELLALTAEQKWWSLQMAGAEPIDGPIAEISHIIDPNQHTAVVKGYIDNPHGQLRAGLYVSATVNLPPPPDVVEVPLTALAEDGKQSCVFLQSDPAQPVYTMRRVRVTHRFDHTAFVRSRLTDKERERTPQEKALGLLPPEPLQAGERIVPAGVLELRSALEDKESKAAKKR